MSPSKPEHPAQEAGWTRKGRGGLSRIHAALLVIMGIAGGVLMDLFLFSATIIFFSNIFMAQWVGVFGGLAHDLIVSKKVNKMRLRKRANLQLYFWIIFGVATGPLVFILGYLTNNVWVAKLIVTLVFHFLFFSCSWRQMRATR